MTPRPKASEREKDHALPRRTAHLCLQQGEERAPQAWRFAWSLCLTTTTRNKPRTAGRQPCQGRCIPSTCCADADAARSATLLPWYCLRPNECCLKRCPRNVCQTCSRSAAAQYLWQLVLRCSRGNTSCRDTMHWGRSMRMPNTSSRSLAPGRADRPVDQFRDQLHPDITRARRRSRRRPCFVPAPEHPDPAAV